jgi:hypothetical protein
VCVFCICIFSNKLDLIQASAALFELDANKIDIACGVVKSLENSTNEEVDFFTRQKNEKIAGKMLKNGRKNSRKNGGKNGGKKWRGKIDGKIGGKNWQEKLAGKIGGKSWQKIGGKSWRVK